LRKPETDEPLVAGVPPALFGRHGFGPAILVQADEQRPPGLMSNEGGDQTSFRDGGFRFPAVAALIEVEEIRIFFRKRRQDPPERWLPRAMAKEKRAASIELFQL
jgi:hypothetical protein